MNHQQPEQSDNSAAPVSSCAAKFDPYETRWRCTESLCAYSIACRFDNHPTHTNTQSTITYKTMHIIIIKIIIIIIIHYFQSGRLRRLQDEPELLAQILRQSRRDHLQLAPSFLAFLITHLQSLTNHQRQSHLCHLTKHDTIISHPS